MNTHYEGTKACQNTEIVKDPTGENEPMIVFANFV